MYQKSRFVVRILVPILLCALILSSGTYVSAQEAANSTGFVSKSEPELSLAAEPVAGGPGFYSISPLEFLPEAWGAGRVFSEMMLINQSADDAWFTAPVHLPHGVQVSKMVGYVYNNSSPIRDVVFFLMSCPLVVGVCEILTSGTSDQQLETPQTIEMPAGPNLIDLQSNYYFVRVKISPTTDIGITGVRIDYGYPVSLPVIMR